MLVSVLKICYKIFLIILKLMEIILKKHSARRAKSCITQLRLMDGTSIPKKPPSVEHAFQLPSASSVAQHWLCLGGTKSSTNMKYAVSQGPFLKFAQKIKKKRKRKKERKKERKEKKKELMKSTTDKRKPPAWSLEIGPDKYASLPKVTNN
ncbi:hypothetical protein ACMD2_23085 [Ananas comosus]|uniref:Uncharacterized protein n=1 Tax=Ananas comosus TaxID=4615 RepID=A0A199V7D3_ANACO|nr:hypothetical protein ACMD2_23085 [Ananas comosus]